MALFEINEIDRRFYAERLRAFLPERLIDIHTHLWLEAFKAPPGDEPVRAVTWPGRVARDSSAEALQETYRLMFPDKVVTPLVFGNVMSLRDDAEGGNAYVSAAALRYGWPALLFSNPRWSVDELERKLAAGGFIGVKVYLTLSEAYLPEKEIRIYDFLPPCQLQALDRRGAVVMLHIPRDGRLRDPVNLAQLLEIEDRYPSLHLIVAHVGRAYCPEDIGNAFDVLARTRRMCFDFSANTNEEVFIRLIEAVGPRRILFGSDLPITRMRMRRICEKGNYVNLIARGAYGDVSGDHHMREVDGGEAARLTLFLYEEIEAFRRAAETTGLNRADVADVFHGNALRMITAAQGKVPGG